MPFNKIRKAGKSGGSREMDHNFGFGHVGVKRLRWSCQIGRWIYESESQDKRSLDDIT